MPYKNKEKRKEYLREYDRKRCKTPKRIEQQKKYALKRRKNGKRRLYEKNYDQTTPRFKRLYGEYYESIIIINLIRKEVIKLVPDVEDRRNLLGRNKIRARQIAWERHIKFGHKYNY